MLFENLGGEKRMKKDKKKPLPAQRKNVFGRKWYSTNISATEYFDNNLNDCWQAIYKLSLLVIVMIVILFRKGLFKHFNNFIVNISSKLKERVSPGN